LLSIFHFLPEFAIIYLGLAQPTPRCAILIVSIMAFWLSFLWILLDNRRQGWHGKIAGTIVIYSRDARAGTYLTEKLKQ
jgi:uncharacterized RDD family membrane protein YckC